MTVSQFARKSPLAAEDSWDADYRRLSEYIVQNAQRRADWSDPKRLQFALSGAFRTKVMYLPTNALVSCVAAYGEANGVPEELLVNLWGKTHSDWKGRGRSTRFLESSPLVRQLRSQPAKLGKRRGGSSKTSIDAAKIPFEFISRHAQEKSDQPLNRSLAHGLRDSLGLTSDQVLAEAAHPWLNGIKVDILVKSKPDLTICIEMFYTRQSTPHILADYVLGKLDRYMKQLDDYQKSPRLLIE